MMLTKRRHSLVLKVPFVKYWLVLPECCIFDEMDIELMKILRPNPVPVHKR